VDSDLASVVELLKSNDDLNRLWMHPVVSLADKQAMVRQLLQGKVHPFTLNLLMLLFDKKRAMLIEQVQKAFRDQFNATRRRATVTVTSAQPLDEGTTSELRQLLSKQLEKEVQMETAVDPALIGGLVLRVEDQVIDNSIRGRLEALRHSLS
jgi:F-type H+-transporting ATPase subunit delta